jgi:hypothetical protein
MLLTRRSFLQSTLAAGLGVAAEVTGGHWLLNPANKIRIGIVGLGPTALEHLSLFSAIPGAEIVSLADPNPQNLHKAASYLRDLGQKSPTLHRFPDDLLYDRSLNALAVPNCDLNGGQLVGDAIATGMSILLDAPPTVSPRRLEQMLELLQHARSAVHFRLADYLYPSKASDIRSWLVRTGSRSAELALALQPSAAREDLRIAVIAALDAVFDASGASDEELRTWGTNPEHLNHIGGYGNSCSISLPANSFGFKSLHAHQFPGMLEVASTLHIQSCRGSMKLSIDSQAHAISSLQTAMSFLATVGDIRSVAPRRSWCAQVAASGADRLLTALAASNSNIQFTG